MSTSNLLAFSASCANDSALAWASSSDAAVCVVNEGAWLIGVTTTVRMMGAAGVLAGLEVTIVVVVPSGLVVTVLISISVTSIASTVNEATPLWLESLKKSTSGVNRIPAIAAVASAADAVN